MPIKIKEKTGNKIIVRCSNPMELQWLMQVLAGMKSPDGKRTPITSVQNLKGEEIKLPQQQKPQPQATPIPQEQTIPQGHLVNPSFHVSSGSPMMVDIDAKIIPTTEIITTPETTIKEKKDEQSISVVDEGKTG